MLVEWKPVGAPVEQLLQAILQHLQLIGLEATVKRLTHNADKRIEF